MNYLMLREFLILYNPIVQNWDFVLYYITCM